MPILSNTRAMGISLMMVGILVLGSCLSYLAYRYVKVEHLTELEQSAQRPISPSLSTSATPQTEQNRSVPISPLTTVGYPAQALIPVEWKNPYWAEDPTPDLYSYLNEDYNSVTWNHLPSGHSLPTGTRIRIPSIQVDASIEELALIDLGIARAYETPDRIVGHIPETANPGGIGNGWYFAHLESVFNKEGAIFRDLPLIPEKIRREEPVFIIVDNENTSYLYQVTKTSIERKENLRVTESSSPMITLVTCVPRLVYDHRLLISAELIGSRPTKS